jgi:hypothetical protein
MDNGGKNPFLVRKKLIETFLNSDFSNASWVTVILTFLSLTVLILL